MAPKAVIEKINGERDTFENARVQRGEADSYFVFRVDEDGNETEEIIREYPLSEVDRAYTVEG